MSDSFTITLTYEDYLAANWLRVRRHWWWKRTLRFILIIGTIYAAMGIVPDLISGPFPVGKMIEPALQGYGLAAAVMCVLALYWLWCIPRAARRVWAEQPLMSAPVLYDFNANGIKVVNERETSDLLWEHIVKWDENDRLLLLSRTRLTFFCIPKSQIAPETLAALRAALIAAQVPTR